MIADGLSIARYHIVVIAMAASLVFGWLTTGRYDLVLALVVGLDWFLINLFNKLTDVEEDRANGIPGTERVARLRRPLLALAITLLVGSFASHLVFPLVTPLRVLVQLIGLAYSYRWIPTRAGRRRIKELYFFKNFGSAFLFVLTSFAYPIAASGTPLVVSWAYIALLVAFFVPFEVSYEILYDFRDLEGDRRAHVPTFPVVHGPRAAARLVLGLLVASLVVLGLAVVAGVFGLRELLFACAPLAQRLFYHAKLERALAGEGAWTSRDCILLTHLGSLQLALFLVGTRAWLALGLPANVFLF